MSSEKIRVRPVGRPSKYTIEEYKQKIEELNKQRAESAPKAGRPKKGGVPIVQTNEVLIQRDRNRSNGVLKRYYENRLAMLESRGQQ